MYAAKLTDFGLDDGTGFSPPSAIPHPEAVARIPASLRPLLMTPAAVKNFHSSNTHAASSFGCRRVRRSDDVRNSSPFPLAGRGAIRSSYIRTTSLRIDRYIFHLSSSIVNNGPKWTLSISEISSNENQFGTA